ncbi:hypothetical protein [Chroococcus sp. FPU101]|uniref:hypothetical protein n=1 Tax=Chroococcus sp. FPU101 TaxID=1974212 RepID=UPI001A90C956|nr:hypothetical protein [Chroococcus sp. FPU101]GFE71830.1 hypothetical protein CFPU101_44400 [Chroococcus sp. FPU101]
MLRNLNNLKTVFLGTTTLALISMGMPDIAQAQFRSTLTTDRYRANYKNILQNQISTGTQTQGRFVGAIQNFEVIDPFPPIGRVPRSYRGFLTLEIRQVPNSNYFVNSNFSNISGPIYEYRFQVTNYNNIPLDPNATPFPYDNNGFIKKYIAASATYRVGSQSFSYNLGTGTSPDPTQNLLTSLGGLNTILGLAKTAGFASIDIPSNIILNNGERAAVTIETMPTPEPNTSASLIVIGLAGSFFALKRKINQG